MLPAWPYTGVTPPLLVSYFGVTLTILTPEGTPVGTDTRNVSRR